MPDLPQRPDFDQLRRQAKDLLRAARGGDAAALARIAAVGGQPGLAMAQLAVARECGFPSWARLKTEVVRREIFNRGDVVRLQALLAQHPELAPSEWSTGATTASAPIRWATWRCSASTPAASDYP